MNILLKIGLVLLLLMHIGIFGLMLTFLPVTMFNVVLVVAYGICVAKAVQYVSEYLFPKDTLPPYE